jgi:hypothetical protein
MKRVRFDEEVITPNKRAWLYFTAPVSAGEALLGNTFGRHSNTVATEILISVPYDGKTVSILKNDILISASPVDTVTGKNGEKEYADTDWKDCFLTFSDVLELLDIAKRSDSRLAGDIQKGIALGMAGPVDLIPHMGYNNTDTQEEPER